MMFLVQNPIQTLPILLDKIKEFRDLAGLYINISKSKLMCKNTLKTKQEEIGKLTECEVVNKTKYLGIDLTMKNIDFYKNSCENLWLQLDRHY